MMKRIFVPTENKSDWKSKENGEGNLHERIAGVLLNSLTQKCLEH